MSLDLDAIKARLAAACPGPWTGMTVKRFIDGDCLAIVREHPEVDHKSEKGTTLTIAATLLPQYGDDATANMLLHAWGDVDALIAEVERLRAQRALDNEDLARAYDMGRDKERAAVVDYLTWRAEMTHYNDAAREFVNAAQEVGNGVHHTIDYEEELP